MRLPTFILWPFLILLTSGRRCGRPGVWDNCTITPDKWGPYEEGEEVTYLCNYGYYTEKDGKFYKGAKRICQCDGRWNGTIPLCNYKDILNQIAFTQNNSLINSANIFYEKDDSCTMLPLQQGKTELTVNFHHVSVTTAKLNLTMSFQNITEQVKLEMLVQFLKNNGEHQICPFPTSTLESKLYNFPCTINFNTAAATAKITFLVSEHRDKLEISLCSLKGLVQLPHVSQCTQPDTPFNGQFKVRKTSNRIYFTCNNGYTLYGDKSSTCQSSVTPICVSENEKKCATLPVIKSGRLVVLSQNCLQEANPNDTAKLECDEGYVPTVQSQRAYCNESTGWTWKFSTTDPRKLPQGNECLLPDNHTTRKNEFLTVKSTINSFYSVSATPITLALTNPPVTNTLFTNASPGVISTEWVVSIAIGALVVICILLFFLYRFRTRQHIRNTTQGTRATANLLTNISTNTRTPPPLVIDSQSSACDRLQYVIQPTRSDEVIYAQIDVLSSPSTSTNHCCLQEESTVYAEIRFPQPSTNAPVVQFSRAYNDTYGKVMTSAPKVKEPTVAVQREPTSKDLLGTPITKNGEQIYSVPSPPNDCQTGRLTSVEEPLYMNTESKFK